MIWNSNVEYFCNDSISRAFIPYSHSSILLSCFHEADFLINVKKRMKWTVKYIVHSTVSSRWTFTYKDDFICLLIPSINYSLYVFNDHTRLNKQLGTSTTKFLATSTFKTLATLTFIFQKSDNSVGSSTLNLISMSIKKNNTYSRYNAHKQIIVYRPIIYLKFFPRTIKHDVTKIHLTVNS